MIQHLIFFSLALGIQPLYAEAPSQAATKNFDTLQQLILQSQKDNQNQIKQIQTSLQQEIDSLNNQVQGQLRQVDSKLEQQVQQLQQQINQLQQTKANMKS